MANEANRNTLYIPQKSKLNIFKDILNSFINVFIKQNK